MKRIFFAVLLLFIGILDSSAYNRKDSLSSTRALVDTIREYKKEADISRKEAASLRRWVDSTRQYLAAVLNRKEDTWTAGTLISFWTGVVGIISLLFTVIYTARNTRIAKTNMLNSNNNFAREGAYKRVSFAAEINKLQIANPEIRAMYDKHRHHFVQDCSIKGPVHLNLTGLHELSIENSGLIKLSGEGSYSINGGENKPFKDEARIEEKRKINLKIEGSGVELDMDEHNILKLKSDLSFETESKIRSFCYYIINNFELVFEGGLGAATAETPAWEAYAEQLIMKSTPFRDLVKEVVSSDKELYYATYLKKLGTIHDSAITKLKGEAKDMLTEE